ncbi:hypothetical protein QBC41DRAFT_26335 [Cercophora samala]|uniref:Uncharacterized protein n=1 Tax=Cercophora samala TaxID=330535 RepID=A0AA39Z3J9_9PEZI|nr:hypothetical protein QBC41DRAFT_26335 [Cercophora samala]
MLAKATETSIHGYSHARLAQSVERETLKEFLRHLKVVGSTPTSGSIPVETIQSIRYFLLFLPRYARHGWTFGG